MSIKLSDFFSRKGCPVALSFRNLRLIIDLTLTNRILYQLDKVSALHGALSGWQPQAKLGDGSSHVFSKNLLQVA